MSFTGTEGFDGYSSTANLATGFSAVGAGWAWNATAGRTGAGAIVGTGTTATSIVSMPIIGAPDGYCMVGFYMKLSAAPAAAAVIYQSQNSSNAVSVQIQINPNGTVTYSYAGGNNSVVTSTLTVTDGNWHWIEALGFGSGFNCNSALYIDNINQGGGGSNNNATVVTVDHYAFQSVPNQTLTIDDVVHYGNATGLPDHTSFPINAVQVTRIAPASDGMVNFSTLSSGSTHFNLVNEVGPDGDASYVADGTSGHQDLYNYSPLGYTPTKIFGVMTKSYLKNPNAGTVNHAIVCKSGATTTAGPTTVTPGLYRLEQTAFSVDPNTSAAWTLAGVNAAQFGIKVP